MFTRRGLGTLGINSILMMSHFLSWTPLWAQHAAHTHGRAELNLVLNADREMIAELITPAESVYGFEHAPRNAKETKQMQEGLQRLRASLPTLLTVEKQMGCTTTEVAGERYAGAVTATQEEGQGRPKTKPGHSAHEHSGSSEGSHAHHHGEAHGHETAESHDEGHHRNVTIRWKIRCGADLTGQNVIVNWSEGLSGIHHLELTLLTPNRQDAISLRRSGQKIRL